MINLLTGFWTTVFAVFGITMFILYLYLAYRLFKAIWEREAMNKVLKKEIRRLKENGQ